ncbi:MFS transporter [Pseudoroseomonas wenyumeiae]
MKGQVNLVAAAFALTALSYGLARFAYGLLLPHIREDLSLSATWSGAIGGSAFAAYCLGIVFAFTLRARLGERHVAVLAGLTATCGMAFIAAASSGWTLGIAFALAGLSSGLASPPLAAAVARCIEDAAQPKANGAINAGTAAGIIFSGLVVMTSGRSWRELYVLFTMIGMAVTVWLWFAMPAAPREGGAGGLSRAALRRPGVLGLCSSALLMGASSTAVWTFAANLMREELAFSDGQIALAWIALGTAGIAGAGTGLLTSRLGIGPVHRLALFTMAVALVTLTIAPVAPLMTFVAMSLFGLGYIVSSGALLLWGITLFQDRPDLGLGLPFLMTAVGQTAGAPLFGVILDTAGSTAALLSFVAVAGSAALWTPSTASPQTKMTATAASQSSNRAPRLGKASDA